MTGAKFSNWFSAIGKKSVEFVPRTASGVATSPILTPPSEYLGAMGHKAQANTGSGYNVAIKIHYRISIANL